MDVREIRNSKFVKRIYFMYFDSNIKSEPSVYCIRISQFPFIIEACGGVAREGRELLRILASHAPDDEGDQGAASFLQHAYRVLSFCLQRGNAMLELSAMEKLHLEETRVRFLPHRRQQTKAA